MYNNVSECLFDVYNNEINNLVIKQWLSVKKKENTSSKSAHQKTIPTCTIVQISRNTETHHVHDKTVTL